MSIKRPQKAPSDPITDLDLQYLPFPVVGSPKLDGFRCIVDHGAKTSSMKRFPNQFLNEVMNDSLYHGLDGELLIGPPNDPDAFHNTSGPLRRIDGNPDFRFYVFDNWIDGLHPYAKRWLEAPRPEGGRIITLEQRLLYSPEDVISYEEEMLSAGYEGAMIRSLSGTYKEGRCSFREMNIFKRKPFVDCEATIVGFIEGLQNLNEPVENETGHMRRSSHAANKVPKGTLGSFRLKSSLWQTEFTAAPGEGYSQDDRQEIWNHRVEYLGQVATVKFQKYGSREAPRIPSVIKIGPASESTE